MKKRLLYLFILLVLTQWVVPAKMIFDHDILRTRGKSFKFQTQPIDPVHPFKGRYVALNFKASRVTVPQPHYLKRGQKIYAVLKKNSGGYAEIDHLLRRKPSKDVDYIKANIRYINNRSDSTTSIIELKYPFDEYFMEESKAPVTEKLFRDSAIKDNQTYAIVKVYKGDSVIEGLFINGNPVETLIEDAAN